MTKTTTKCQMLSGRCGNAATLALRTDARKPLHGIDLAGDLTIRTYRAPSRTIHACETHRPQLEASARMYGGRVRTHRG